MKLVLIFSLLTVFISCSIEQKSEIQPFAEAKTLSDKLEKVSGKDGNGIVVNIKIPLTKNTIGHYALDDIMNPDEQTEGEPQVTTDEAQLENLPEKKKGTFKRMIESLKYNIYNMGLGIGLSNRVSYSTEYLFPDLDPTYFKEVRVEKIFFALEPCAKTDKDCQQRQANKPISLMFLDKFFVNLSTVDEESEKDVIEDPLQFLNKDIFKKKVNRAWGTQPINFNSFKNDSGEIPDHVFKNINVARFSNSKKTRKKIRENIRDNGRMYIARVEKNRIIDVKDFLERDEFKGIIKDITILGRSIYIELYHSQLKDKFFKTINEIVVDVRKYGVEDLSGCTNLNCANLTVNPIDLVPMIQKSGRIKIDTFLSLKHLDWNDFKYSGYIEIKVKLELPRI